LRPEETSKSEMSAHQSTARMTRPAVLIIAPDSPLTTVLAEDLLAAGCQVRSASSGVAGLACLTAFRPDVVLLPQELPGEDPLDVCRHIRRSATVAQPLLVLTPSADERDLPASAPCPEIGGLGSDRLVAALRALAECSVEDESEDSTVVCDGLRMDVPRHRAASDGRDLHLTPTEFRLLWTLARQPGRVFTRQQLTLVSCSNNVRAQVRTIDAHIKSIRQKLGPRAYLIETVHGVGYRFHEDGVVS
jgi:two-component system phosphate regulon response regulator PhoB